MKFLFILVITAFVSKDNPIAIARQNEINCDRIVNLGNSKLCIPSYNGMIECYLNPEVTKFADENEFPDNSTLALYVNNETAKYQNDLGGYYFDDYFKIYIYNQLKFTDANEEDFFRFTEKMSLGFEKWDLNELMKKLEIYRSKVTFDVPILLKEYSLSKNSRTLILMTRLFIDEKEVIMLSSANAMLVKKRIVFSSYYLFYSGIESIDKHVSKNDYLVHKFLTINN